jgi:hypothetical protein
VQDRLRAVSAFYGGLVNSPTPSPRRTKVYVDSWNLYFGSLKGTPYRWVNIAEMARLSLPAHYRINRIRFFTARVSARPNNPQTPVRQDTLSRALRTLPNLTMHFGQFLVNRTRMPLASPQPGGARFADVIQTGASSTSTSGCSAHGASRASCPVSPPAPSDQYCRPRRKSVPAYPHRHARHVHQAAELVTSKRPSVIRSPLLHHAKMDREPPRSSCCARPSTSCAP